MPSFASRVLFSGSRRRHTDRSRSRFRTRLDAEPREFLATSRDGSPAIDRTDGTPVAWTSFSTGCTPLVHGVHDFNYLDPHDRTIRDHHAGTVRVPLFGRSSVNLAARW